MDCYIIPPLSCNELMHEGSGNRYFALAHLYIQVENEQYRQFFKDRLLEGKWVTLDNGAAEQDLVTEDILIECVKDLMPSEVIAPDVLFNHTQTMSNLDCFVDRMIEEKLIDRVQIFFAPQGKTIKDWLECYEYGLINKYVNTIGMSKIAIPHAWFAEKAFSDQNIGNARFVATKYLNDHNLITKPLHYLGAGEVSEFSRYKQFPKIQHLLRSTDSCFTVWSAMNHIDFNMSSVRIPTPHDYFDRQITPIQKLLTLSNIKILKNNLP